MMLAASAKIVKAVHWLSSVLVISFSVLLTGVFIGSGILTGKPGLVVCGIGWALVNVSIYYRRQSAKHLAHWSVIVGVIGVLLFVLGLVVHDGGL